MEAFQLIVRPLIRKIISNSFHQRPPHSFGLCNSAGIESVFIDVLHREFIEMVVHLGIFIVFKSYIKSNAFRFLFFVEYIGLEIWLVLY